MGHGATIRSGGGASPAGRGWHPGISRGMSAACPSLVAWPRVERAAVAVFSNQRLFTESVRDFYAYLAGTLSRYDLAGEEYAQFKELLLVRGAAAVKPVPRALRWRTRRLRGVRGMSQAVPATRAPG